MNILAVESSTSFATVAVEINGKIYSRESYRQNGHTEFVSQAIQDCLSEAAVKLSMIDIFCCSQGPGSFTGIRVASSAAKSLSYAFQKPLFWRNSLELINTQNPTSDLQLVLVNAFKNMLYVSAFKNNRVIADPCSIRFLDLKNFVHALPGDRISLVGEALSIYPQIVGMDSRLQRPESPKDLPHAITLIQEAKTHQNNGWTKDWKDFHPLYIRASEAEEKSRVI